MKYKPFFLLIGVFTLVFSCSNPQESSQADVAVQESTVVVTPTHILSVELEGMSCEMGCGASIRKELLSTQAVERVQFDFKMGRKTNIAHISYNESDISPEKITARITQLNDQQFSIHSIDNKRILTQ